METPCPRLAQAVAKSRAAQPSPQPSAPVCRRACRAVGAAAAAAADPIMELIATHRAAGAAVEAAARHLCDVEGGAADDGGQDRGTGADDVPFFLAALAAFDAADEAEARAAWALARARLTGPAAAAALLRYVADVEADDREWPAVVGHHVGDV